MDDCKSVFQCPRNLKYNGIKFDDAEKGMAVVRCKGCGDLITKLYPVIGLTRIINV
jgi:hypothetical protein